MIENLMASLGYIIPFLVVITVLVFFHELGHYLVARWNGVKIEVFSIGFGPELFGWTDKHQTRWKFSVLPFGGYVRMYGDADPSGQAVNPELVKMTAEEKSLTLQSKTPKQRIAVVAAGPIANYILAVVLLMGLFLVKGEPILTNEISMVTDGSVAQSLGIQSRDRIVRINDHNIQEFKDLPKALEGLAGKDIRVELLRPKSETSEKVAGESQTESERMILTGKMLLPSKDPTHSESIPADKLGVAPAAEYKPIGFVSSFVESVKMCYTLSAAMLQGLGKLITGQGSGGDLGGVLSIGHQAKQFASKGVADLILFMALISVNLGLINLFPVPVVDGGHILLYSIEAIRGKPMSEKIQEKMFMVGLFLVLGLMIYTTLNDLHRFRVFDWVMSFFK